MSIVTYPNHIVKDILDKADISQEDLSKLHRIPAVVSLASLVIGLLLIFSHYNTGWVRGMMWINGEVRPQRKRPTCTASAHHHDAGSLTRQGDGPAGQGQSAPQGLRKIVAAEFAMQVAIWLLFLLWCVLSLGR